MQLFAWTTCLWPGLSRLWVGGKWLGLFSSLMFAVLLNVAMTCQFIWTDVIAPEMMLGLWSIVGLIWVIGILDGVQYMISNKPIATDVSDSVSDEQQSSPRETEEPIDLFIEARDAYLQGNWIKASEVASQLVEQDRRDVAAWLLLIAVNRRCNEIEEASRLLKLLTSQAGSSIENGNWTLQVRQEATLIEQARTRLQGDGVAA